MRDEGNGFEESLQEDLRRMADEAPAAPGLRQVKLRLRRRRIQRFAWASMVGMGVGALIIIGTLAYIYLETLEEMITPAEVVVERQPISPDPDDGVRLTQGPTVLRVRPVPIPADAEDALIRQMFRHYLSSVGAESGVIEKRAGTGPSFTLIGDIGLSNEDLLTEVGILLENFDEASLSLVEGRVQYSLSRMEGI